MEYIIATIIRSVAARLVKVGGGGSTSWYGRDGAARAPRHARGAGSVPSSSGAPNTVHKFNSITLSTHKHRIKFIRRLTRHNNNISSQTTNSLVLLVNVDS